MIIQTLMMCGKIVPSDLLIISWSKKVFYSKTTDCALLNVLYEEQLLKKLMGEVLLDTLGEVWLDTLEETKLWLLCKKISIDLSWTMMLYLLWEAAEPAKLLRVTIKHWVVHTITNSQGFMGRCQLRLCFGFASNSKKQGFNYGGGWLIFKDGSFCSL